MAKIRKAIVAAVTAFAGTLAVAFADEVITGEEWATIASATVIAAAGVWTIPNARSGVENS